MQPVNLFFSAESTQSKCPDDLLKSIFCLLTELRDFKSFACASIHLNNVSKTIAIHTIASSSLRTYLFSRALSLNPKFKEVSEKILQLYIERTNAESELMTVLEECGKELHLDPNSSDVLHFYNHASKRISIFLKAQETPVQPEMTAILDSIVKNCNYAMITMYANQPVECITMQSYSDKAQELLQVFPQKSAIVIEAILRKTLREKHKAAFLQQSDEYFSQEAKITLLPHIQEELRIEMEATKARMEIEVADLLRTIEDATLELEKIEQQLPDCKNAGSKKEKKSSNNPIKEDVDWQAHTDAHRLREQRKTCQAKLKNLARYDKSGHLIGGKLAFLQKSLDSFSLEDLAAKKMESIGLFYFELAQAINEKNQKQRFKILHGKNILGFHEKLHRK